MISDLSNERATDRNLAAALFAAVSSGNVDRFLSLSTAISLEGYDGWKLALRRISKLKQVSPGIQNAFQMIWVESKSIRRLVDNDLITIDALRVLLPAYRGNGMRLYRGESAMAKRRYGISWTDELSVARRFATDARQKGVGGSLVLQVEAPAVAIISTTLEGGDHYGEREYLVDRRLLRRVSVLERFPQIVDTTTSPSLSEAEAMALLGTYKRES